MSKVRTKQLNSFIKFKNGKKAPKNLGEIPIYGGNGILGYCNDIHWNTVEFDYGSSTTWDAGQVDLTETEITFKLEQRCPTCKMDMFTGGLSGIGLVPIVVRLIFYCPFCKCDHAIDREII